ncbi:hypothetical protein SCHPADRAFT_885697 [Schizopora paradoxa]|uniref:Uncharacterized protein n=1 Tax=Schizopora paradoxa TaxID=27342 RepID=A0A0H2S463_9AGAM|nr:hypothetical protein SCHPADRAFT_885697 [Schizopora paradoxa]
MYIVHGERLITLPLRPSVTKRKKYIENRKRFGRQYGNEKRVSVRRTDPRGQGPRQSISLAKTSNAVDRSDPDPLRVFLRWLGQQSISAARTDAPNATPAEDQGARAICLAWKEKEKKDDAMCHCQIAEVFARVAVHGGGSWSWIDDERREGRKRGLDSKRVSKSASSGSSRRHDNTDMQTAKPESGTKIPTLPPCAKLELTVCAWPWNAGMYGNASRQSRPTIHIRSATATEPPIHFIPLPRASRIFSAKPYGAGIAWPMQLQMLLPAARIRTA